MKNEDNASMKAATSRSQHTQSYDPALHQASAS